MIEAKNINDSESEAYVEVIDMKRADWKKYIHDLIDNVERELRPSAPAKSRAALNEFRTRIGRDHIRRRRRRFQNDLDKLLDTDPVLHTAANRFMKKLIREATKKLKTTLKNVQANIKILKANKRDRERASQ